MNNSIKILLGLVICIFISYGCEKETIKPAKVDVTGTISFSKVIVPIFQAKCIACHNNIGPSPDLSTTPNENLIQILISGHFINTSSPASSLLYIELTNPSMASTNSTEQQEILNWIAQGALNN